MDKILVILTCYNRMENTKNCIQTLTGYNKNIKFTFVIVDDGSTDGTVEALEMMSIDYDIHLIKESGNLFYSGGMRKGMKFALEQLDSEFNYMLMVNDDVEFYFSSIEQMVEQSKVQSDAIIVGAMNDDSAKISYSAIRYTNGIHYEKIDVSEWESPADSFNANCVLIPYNMFCETEIIDSHYVHSLGDFDYGLSLKRKGFNIFVSKIFVGKCNNNSNENTWLDRSLSIKERIKLKESVKGAPIKQWFYFLNKNFGFFTALKGSITPYIRILVGK